MIPDGFATSPYIFPMMYCPACGFHFQFMEPFDEFDTVTCAECEEVSNIPDSVIKDFHTNMDFRDYLNTRKKRQAPPPANT